MKLEWYEIHDNLALLTRWMADHDFDADSVAYAVEKPHRFEVEFNQACAEQADEDEQEMTIR